jgi:hypothetical protein
MNDKVYAALKGLIKTKAPRLADDQNAMTRFLKSVKGFDDGVIEEAIENLTLMNVDFFEPSDLYKECQTVADGKKVRPDWKKKYNGITRDEQLDICASYRRYGASDQHGNAVLPEMMRLWQITDADITAYEERREAGLVDKKDWRT